MPIFNVSLVVKEPRILSNKRTEVHNKDILSILYGSMLGDAHGEKRPSGNGTRFTFQQEKTHLAYGLWLHSKISDLGYGSKKVPLIEKRLGHGGKVRQLIRFRTWTYTSFNFIHKEFYNKNGIKRVPKTLSLYLTPLVLAIWIMDDGAKVGKGLKFCTNSFSYKDSLYLATLLFEKYNLKSSVHSAGAINQYNVYVWKASMPNLRAIVDPYIVPSMRYKILD